MAILKSGACFTEELELNCPTIVGCVTALPAGQAAVAGTTQVLGKDGQYHTLPAAPVIPTPVAPALSVAGNQLTIAGGNTVTLPDSDAQALSISGNVISLTNGGSVTLPAGTVTDGSETKVIAGTNVTVTGSGTTANPYVVTAAAAAATVFATPAETVAGTSTTLAVNPADLYARENIAAQTALSNNLAAIPAPAANQSPWATNALGETLHYAPGLGWKIVADLYGTSTNGSPTALSPNVLTPVVGASLTIPRRGKIAVAVNGLMTGAASSAGDFGFGITLNGTLFATHRIFYTSPVDEYQDFLQTVLAGYVNPGDVLAFVAITSASGFTMTLPTIRYQYVS